MTEVGGTELILLLIIGLIVLGPKRLPEIANKIGGWIGQARRMTRVMKRQLEDELRLNEDFSIKPPAPAAKPKPAADKPAANAAPTAADAAGDAAPEAHVPHDDDGYSPLHEDPPATDEADDSTEEPAK